MSNPNDFVIKNGTLVEYVGSGGDVVIPEGVTRIGRQAFFSRNTVSSEVIPAGVTDIDKEAFIFCRNLKEIKLPESVTRIGEKAFAYCTSLQTVSLPSNITNLEKKAFPEVKYLKVKKWIKGLTQAISPDILREIDIEDLGKVPSKLKGLIVCKDGEAGDKLKTVQDFVIRDSVLTDYKGNGGEVLVPHGVTKIGKGAFKNCLKMTGVILPSGLISIEESAFEGCTNLQSVGLPEEIVKRYPLRSVRIPMREGVISMNLSDCVSIVLYEALRQNAFKGLS